MSETVVTHKIPAVAPRVRIRSMAAAPPKLASPHAVQAGPRIAITEQPLAALTPASRQLRRRGRGQVERLVANIVRVGCLVPVFVTGAGEIIDGHGIFEACRMLGYENVHTIVIDHLSDSDVRALRFSLNKLSEQSSWDPDAIAAEFADLLKIDPDLIAFTGFSMPEIDLVLAACGPEVDDLDAAHVEPMSGPAVSRAGDEWQF